MREFICNIDWDSFWLSIVTSSIFFLLGIPLAIKVIPYFTIRQINKKNKKSIIRKVSSVIQEMSFFVNNSPFKNKELNKGSVSICTKKNDIKNHRFISLININLYDLTVYPRIELIILKQFEKLTPDDGLLLIEKEEIRIKEFRLILENIINAHSQFIDDSIISRISDLCLDMRAYEIEVVSNYGIDDLIEKGLTERVGVFGVSDLAKLYKKIFKLLHDLIDKRHFEIEIKTSS